MKRIMLFCSAGMSTSLLVSKMQAAAKKKNIDVEITAYPEAEANEKGKDADIILLGPQIRYRLKAIQKMYPDKAVDVIDMRMYGLMDGEGVLQRALNLLNK